jgi:hypothetical protein
MCCRIRAIAHLKGWDEYGAMVEWGSARNDRRVSAEHLVQHASHMKSLGTGSEALIHCSKVWRTATATGPWLLIAQPRIQSRRLSFTAQKSEEYQRLLDPGFSSHSLGSSPGDSHSLLKSLKNSNGDWTLASRRTASDPVPETLIHCSKVWRTATPTGPWLLIAQPRIQSRVISCEMTLVRFSSETLRTFRPEPHFTNAP